MVFMHFTLFKAETSFKVRLSFKYLIIMVFALDYLDFLPLYAVKALLYSICLSTRFSVASNKLV